MDCKRFRNIVRTKKHVWMSSKAKILTFDRETPASIRENSIVFGKHRKRVSPHLLQSTPTECSGTILQIRRLKCKYQDILPPTSRLETRSTSMTSRRQFHRDSSVERLGSQRVRQRDRVNVSESVTAPATQR